MTDHIDLARFYDLAASPDDLRRLEEAGPVLVINHFALRDEADYEDVDPPASTGLEALLRYSAVSGERLDAVGGTFIDQIVAPVQLWGTERWDVVVTAAYPSGRALRDLLRDDDYRASYRHRRAAVARQLVTVGLRPVPGS